jgi:type II secretory pathway component PulM
MTTGSRAMRLPAPVSAWLAEHSPAERRIAVTLSILVAVAALWTALWQPMARDAASMRLSRPANAAALAQAREMTKEMAGLARAGAAITPTDARTLLERVLARHNVRAAVTSLDWRDDRAHLVLAAVDYDALISVLEAVQREAHLRAVEATLTARVEPGTVRAEVTLAR